MRVAFGQSALMEIDCPSFPLFVTLSYEMEAWPAIRAISLVVIAPPDTLPLTAFRQTLIETNICTNFAVVRFTLTP